MHSRKKIRGIQNSGNSVYRSFQDHFSCRLLPENWKIKIYIKINFVSVLSRYNTWSLILTFKTLPVTWCTNSLTFSNCTFCPHCIHVFCIYLRTNSDLCHLQPLIGFYNRDEKFLLRGANWVLNKAVCASSLKG